MPDLVQFMHNGREPIPDSKTGVGWNKKKHARKFLTCNGIMLDESLKKLHGRIMFWGEWEPESLLVKKIKNGLVNGPHYVYEPYFVRPRSYRELQNTDPFVFGGEFWYSWCLQPKRRSLRELDKGSVILFGSRLNWEFVLDTIFVIHDCIPYSRENNEELLRRASETYGIVTANPILKGKACVSADACTRAIKSAEYKAYLGVTFEERAKYNGMFSYFPCQIYKEDSLGFARPRIKLSAISDKMGRGIKKTSCNNLEDMKKYWDEVTKQVKKTCSLGIYAEMPPEHETS